MVKHTTNPGRESRKEETRETESRTESWSPPTVLPDPDPQEGWVFRWDFPDRAGGQHQRIQEAQKRLGTSQGRGSSRDDDPVRSGLALRRRRKH